MGIKGFNPFIKEKCCSAFVNLPYSYFKGKRVAWDSDNVFRKLMSRAHKDVVNKTDVAIEEPDREEIVELWLEYCRGEIFRWLEFGSTPLFIFDGDYIDEKSETQKKRRADKRKRIKEAEDLKGKIQELDELERTVEMITSLRKKMHHLGYISSDEKEVLMGILSACGFPVLIATEEGEKLCAMLCIEGKVDAVYSRDTDVVAMGCPLVIREDGGWAYDAVAERNVQIVKCTVFKPILPALEMEYKSFLDLCIMSGCDFNVNIPKCAIKTAYKLLIKHNIIEDIPSETLLRYFRAKKIPEKYKSITEITEVHTKVLNHVRCREIFCYQPSEDVCQECLVLDVNRDLSESRDMLGLYNAAHWLGELNMIYKTLPEPSTVCIERRPCYIKSRVKLNIVREDNGIAAQEVDEIEKILNSKKVSKPSPKHIKPRSVKSMNMRQLQKYREKNQKETPIIQMRDNSTAKPRVKLNILP